MKQGGRFDSSGSQTLECMKTYHTLYTLSKLYLRVGRNLSIFEIVPQLLGQGSSKTLRLGMGLEYYLPSNLIRVNQISSTLKSLSFHLVLIEIPMPKGHLFELRGDHVDWAVGILFGS